MHLSCVPGRVQRIWWGKKDKGEKQWEYWETANDAESSISEGSDRGDGGGMKRHLKTRKIRCSYSGASLGSSLSSITHFFTAMMLGGG